MIDKAWLCINELLISNEDVEILYKSFGDRLKNLKVNKLWISKGDNEEISYEIVEALKLINPCTLSFRNLDWSYETLKMLFSLNSENIEAEFENNLWVLTELEFTEVNIVMFDSKQNHSMKLMCRSTIIEVFDVDFKDICLLKADKYKFSDSDCLFIPFTSIFKLEIFDYKVNKSLTKNEKQFALINEDIDIFQGLIIPVSDLSLAIFYLYYAFTNSLNKNSIVTNEILRKAKQVDWRVKYFDELYEMKNMFQNYFNRIKFSFWNFNLLTSKKNQEIELCDIELICPTFSVFEFCQMIFEDDLMIVWNLLSSRRTRFNLTCVNLKLNLLSECLTVLSLCAKCPELKSVSLKFIGWDEDDEKEAINNAIKKFIRNVGFIQLIEINYS